MNVLEPVLVLNLIGAYACEEPTLLALVGCPSVLVAVLFSSVPCKLNVIRVNKIIRLSGPALLSGLLLWLIKNCPRCRRVQT